MTQTPIPNVYIVPVPEEAKDIGIVKDGDLPNLYYKDIIGCAQFIGLPDGDWQVHGILTPNHIDFDSTPFLVHSGNYYDGDLYWCYGDESDKYGYEDMAFHSLIQASGYTYSNPYGEKEPPQKTYDALGSDLNIEWHNAQQNVLQKGVIIKKI